MTRYEHEAQQVVANIVIKSRFEVFHLALAGTDLACPNLLNDALATELVVYVKVRAVLGGAAAIADTALLLVLGVPYAVLFGFLAGALRFVPYVGIWFGAGLPVVISMAVFPGWTKALMVIGLGYYGQPEDVAKVHLFLASEDADYVSGVVLPVSGALLGGM